MNYENELPAEVITGIQLFNEGAFFEAHEMLEIAWKEEKGNNRYLHQAILQLGVGYYHLQRNNLKGAEHLFERAKRNLVNFSGSLHGIDIDLLKKQLDEAIAHSVNSQILINQFHKYPLHRIEINR